MPLDRHPRVTSYALLGAVIVASSLDALGMLGVLLADAPTTRTAQAQAQERSRTSGFTPDEARALARGELVERPLARGEGRGREFGGASFQRVRAPIDTVWREARDPDAFPELVPSLDRVRVVEARGDLRVLHMHHSYAIGETSYYVQMTVDDRAHALVFHLDPTRPHDIRAGRGFLRLSPYRGDTIVSWGMVMDPGSGLVLDAFAPALTGWLLRPPRCMRDAVEPGRVPSC